MKEIKRDDDKTITLQFADTFLVIKYLIENEIPGVQTNNRACTVTGEISSENINIACTKYNAYLHYHAYLD